jgi:hypothetical protein
MPWSLGRGVATPGLRSKKINSKNSLLNHHKIRIGQQQTFAE